MSGALCSRRSRQNFSSRASFLRNILHRRTDVILRKMHFIETHYSPPTVKFFRAAKVKKIWIRNTIYQWPKGVILT